LIPELLQKAFELYKAYDDKNWGMTDCVSFVVMREEEVTEALTSDQHYVQTGFTALMKV
jgi:predicted nucleic acid-binding protein